jgi:hypothetical protein
MSAVVVAFEAFRPSPQRPWQNHELAELYRAVDILKKAGLPIETDMGMSDEGEPWFAFCRADNGEVIVHCARINGLFVASSVAIDQTFKGTNFREVIDSIVRYEPLKVSLTTAGSRLTLHPIMVLAAFVATALLFAQKADAHDLHAAIVTLNGGGHDAAAPKGLAAFKAVIGGFFQSLAEGSANLRTGSQSAQATDAEAPAALAALMAAAMSLISTTAQSYGIEDLLPAGAAVVTPVAAQVSSLAIADPASTLSVPLDRSAPAPQPVEDSAYQSWVGALIAGSGLTESKPVITTTPAITHEAAPSVDLSSVLPAADSVHAAAVAVADQHFIFPLQHIPVATSAPATIDTGATTATTSAPASAAPATAFNMSEVSSVALAVLLGQGTLPNNADALKIFEDSHNNAVGPKGGDAPGAGDEHSPAAAGGDHAAALQRASQPQPSDPTPSTPHSVAPDGNSQSPNTPVAPPPPDPQTPSVIWLTGDPTTGMAQIMTYAESNHPLQGNPTYVPAADLMAAINDYSTGGVHPRLLVFDSNAIHLPFFEFSQGVLMVSDHELGITPSAAALSGATTVELASGGVMKILGVIDLAQHPLV